LAGAKALSAYAEAGFDTFDMADHYGSAELITGEMLRRWKGADTPRAFTKWCPEPGPMTPEIVRAGVQERLDRLGVERVDLLQFHWWTFEHPAWLDALHEMTKLRAEGLIGEIGVTNFDAAHLDLAFAEGIPLVSNQVSFSLDRPARGRPSRSHLQEAQCAPARLRNTVRRVPFRPLAGARRSPMRWRTGAAPNICASSRPPAAGMCYQHILRAAGGIARKHGVSISNVATRWVLEHAHVAGVIVGARLGENQHRDDNLKLFQFELDADDHAMLDRAFRQSHPDSGRLRR
jgi:aryl-alcohol dehydrogenase-like predicted oxidoreductase